MKTFDELILVNYSHKDCIPLMNVMRLPEKDAYLYSRFVKLGGRPEEKHLLSFVIEGSEYLFDWFGRGIKSKLYLKDILPCHISFTVGDSGAEYEKRGNVEVLTVDNLKEQMRKHGSGFDDFMKAAGKHYIEAQIWSDKYITEEYLIK